jgi:hypothetical protein
MQHAKQLKYFESTRGTRPIVGGWNAHRRSAKEKQEKKGKWSRKDANDDYGP